MKDRELRMAELRGAMTLLDNQITWAKGRAAEALSLKDDMEHMLKAVKDEYRELEIGEEAAKRTAERSKTGD